ncbi:MAG: ribosome biogenesis GTPase Der, partial [Candidatus Magasanikbacteria bacterium]
MTEAVEQSKNDLPIVALVGRVNVGKSTLFNRLIEEKQAIVSDIPGTTRTSNEGMVIWRGKQIRLIDTGGLTFTDDVPLEKDILIQTERAMKQADLIIFLTDGKDGVLPQEKELAKRMRRIETKPVFLVANKIHTKKQEKELTDPDWYKLGLGDPFPISATSGRNVGDLLDKIYSELQKSKRRPKKSKKDIDTINISIIGKPNVGKSSLFNKLIGEDKVIVSEMAHTTREPHDTLVEYTYTLEKKKMNQRIKFIDTAGIRRKAKVHGKLEREGIFKSIDSLKDSDLILFVLDGSEVISSQDMQLGGLIERRAKSVIILINKWDLAEDASDTQRNFTKKKIYSYFPHLDFAPIEFVSGLTGVGVHKIFPLIMKVWEARHTKIANRGLENFLNKATKEHRPSRGKGTRHPKLLGIKQLEVAPPVFEIAVKFRTSL